MKVLLFANTDWYLYNFRLAQVQALRERGDEVVLVSPDGLYGPRMQALGIRWLQFPLARRSLKSSCRNPDGPASAQVVSAGKARPGSPVHGQVRSIWVAGVPSSRHPFYRQLGDRPRLCFYGGRERARVVAKFCKVGLLVGVTSHLGHLSKPG